MTSQERHSLAASIASKSDPSSAARALIAPAEERFTAGSPESDIEGGLRPVWESIIDVSADTEHQSQEPLVSVVRAIQQQSFAKAPGTGSANDFSGSQWRNINAFLARLTSLSPSTPAFDFSMFGLWTLRSAFEGTGEASPADMDAAKVWLEYAGDVLVKLSNEGKSFPAK
ncbi:hypothetical protein ACLOAV_006171 [Pseudogymnoascus australis]